MHSTPLYVGLFRDTVPFRGVTDPSHPQDGPEILHNLSFDIKSGERVGVVGRTGSGKSSLTLALLRCIFTGGEVYYDGLPISSVNLDSLRSNITIIPQMVLYCPLFRFRYRSTDF